MEKEKQAIEAKNALQKKVNSLLSKIASHESTIEILEIKIEGEK